MRRPAKEDRLVSHTALVLPIPRCSQQFVALHSATSSLAAPSGCTRRGVLYRLLGFMIGNPHYLCWAGPRAEG